MTDTQDHLRHLRLAGIIEDFTYLDGTYVLLMYEGERIRLTEDEASIFVLGAMYADRRIKVEIDEYFR